MESVNYSGLLRQDTCLDASMSDTAMMQPEIRDTLALPRLACSLAAEVTCMDRDKLFIVLIRQTYVCTFSHAFPPNLSNIELSKACPLEIVQRRSVEQCTHA